MTILPNVKVDYNSPLLSALTDDYEVLDPVSMHCFWSGVFSEKQLTSIKSIFASQKSYDFKITIWHNEVFSIDGLIQEQFNKIVSMFPGKIELREFKLEDETVDVSRGLVGIDINLGSPGGNVGWSDVVRMCVLYKYGGLWFDLDCMFLRDLKPLFSYRAFVYSWEWHNWANSAIMFMNSPKCGIMTRIMERCVQMKTCHPKMVFNFEVHLDGLYVFPTYVFDPAWAGCVQNVPISGFRDCYNIMNGCKETVDYDTIMPCSYVWHWHNKWRDRIDQTSIFRQIANQIDEKLKTFSDKNKINHLISFATLHNGYKMPIAHERWSKQIEHLKHAGLVKDGKIYSEDDLDRTWNDRFGKYDSDYGYAYWSWKPYLIKQAMDKMHYGETLCYFDGGCVLPSKDDELEKLGGQIIQKLDEIKDNGYDIGLTHDRRIPCGYIIRQEIVDKMGLTGNKEFLYEFPHWQAGLVLIVKTPRAEQLINDWVQFFFDNYESCIHSSFKDRTGQINGFIHNGADQAIFQCLLYKGQYKILDLNNILISTTKRQRN